MSALRLIGRKNNFRELRSLGVSPFTIELRVRMEEESYGSSERSSTSSEESAPYSTDNSSHATNPMNSEEEEEEEESSSSDDYPSKRRKHGPIVEEEDRISTLPDSILLTILSSLCTKDAVRTGVLSKRWAYLWTFVPSLRFTDYYLRHAADYASFVDNVLLLHRASKLTNFSVEVEYNPELKPRVDLWVRFATTAKVDQLSLLLSSCFYKLPQHLYANEFVSELDFRACEIKPNGLVRWSSLKRLCLWNVALPKDVLNQVLLGSPRLEFLELRSCDKFNRLDIVSESLKKLVMDSYCEDGLELEIVAPKIESLEIIGEFYGMKKCQIKNASALVEVRLDFEITMEYEEEEQEEDHYKNCENVVRELFESLHQVKKLIVGRWCLKVLSIMSVKHLSCPVLNCKCLTMKTSMEKWNLPGIASLLQSSPYVETLVIDIIFSNHDSETESMMK
ncbi:putative F-box protein At1g49610 isoform X2 [Quercus robur]|uniref:putative F-box protein At1g49610 isoform X2 n=1 Tax=Quercus robur TaxID=38942 RepID=UPI0021617D75|nr:putative F-box protein At1g49610 isoform X2 [Quercus robur]